ncbi:hypothetical protein ACFWR6_07200 [Streptomyces griseus]|uniref:hypothetical protein n=1 Tax=Streptomyces griseus TaxID=1911 RepID=UPI003663F88F
MGAVEPFEPEYVRPAQQPCPDCACCTAALCERGRHSLQRCAGHVGDAMRATVAECVCSAASTARTAAWMLDQVRITRLAREAPIREDAMALLRDLVAGGAAEAWPDTVQQLTVRNLAEIVDEVLGVTGRGRTYLAAVDAVRKASPIRVVDVNAKRRLALVEVAEWRAGERVPVLLDQLTTDTGIPAEGLTLRWLEADANVEAATVDDLVLTAFRPMSPMAPKWEAVGGDVS